MGKENIATTTNASGSANRKLPFYRKRTSATDGNTNIFTLKAAVREMKFHMHNSVKRKTSESFRNIKEIIYLKIQKTFDDPMDITESIRNKNNKAFEKTKLVISTSTEADVKTMENMFFMEDFKIDFIIYRSECKKFDGAWIKAYALIWDTYCSKDIQRTIKEMSTYENTILNNPLVLLSTVEDLMHTPEKAKYPTLAIIEVLLSFLKVRQGDDEELFDYLSRFKMERDIVMRLVGNNLIDGYIRNLPAYIGAVDYAGRKVAKKKELEKFMATLFLRNASYDRFGDLILECRKAYAGKELKYPDNLQTMMDLMRQQPLKKKRTDSPIKNSPQKAIDDNSGASCFATTKGGDKTDKKKSDDKKENDYNYYYCGGNKCRLYRFPKNTTLPSAEWFNTEYAKKHNHTQMVLKDVSEKVVESSEIKEETETVVRFSGAQTHTINKIENPEVIWDSGSPIVLAKKISMLQDIKPCQVRMCSNGGNRTIEEEGYWPGVGQSYLDEKVITDIVYQSEAVKRGYKLKFDSDIENYFIVTDLVGRVTRYPCDERRLYVLVHLPPVNCHVSFVNATTVEGYTQREVERESRAWKLYHDLSA